MKTYDVFDVANIYLISEEEAHRLVDLVCEAKTSLDDSDLEKLAFYRMSKRLFIKDEDSLEALRTGKYKTVDYFLSKRMELEHYVTDNAQLINMIGLMIINGKMDLQAIRSYEEVDAILSKRAKLVSELAPDLAVIGEYNLASIVRNIATHAAIPNKKKEEFFEKSKDNIALLNELRLRHFKASSDEVFYATLSLSLIFIQVTNLPLSIGYAMLLNYLAYPSLKEAMEFDDNYEIFKFQLDAGYECLKRVYATDPIYRIIKEFMDVIRKLYDEKVYPYDDRVQAEIKLISDELSNAFFFSTEDLSHLLSFAAYLIDSELMKYTSDSLTYYRKCKELEGVRSTMDNYFTSEDKA